MPRRVILKVLKVILTLLAAVTCDFSQTPPKITQKAKDTTCSNIVALAGNIDIKCSSLTPTQKKLIESIPALLNKIISNQLDPNAVMEKLDEILKAVNPNVPPRKYQCTGSWSTAGAGPGAAFEIQLGGNDSAFQEMVRLNNTRQYASLIKACLAQIDSSPEWLTPRLFCGLAYLGTGDKVKAKSMLDEFDSKTGPAYDTEPCQRIFNFLHDNLK